MTKKIHSCPNCGNTFPCAEPYNGPLQPIHVKILEILRESKIPLTTRQVFNILFDRGIRTKLQGTSGRLCELRDLGYIKLEERKDGPRRRTGFWSLVTLDSRNLVTGPGSYPGFSAQHSILTLDDPVSEPS